MEYSPIVAIAWIGVLLSTAMSLSATAEIAADKVTTYAEDATNAIDCAFAGVALEQCSPDLTTTEFKQDLKSYDNQINAIKQELEQTQHQE